MAQGDLLGTLTGSSTSTLAANDLTGSVAVAVGDLVFVNHAEITSLTASGVTDNLGNTYTAQNAGTDAGNATGRAFYSRVTNAGTLTTVTVAASASANDWVGIAAAFEGPFDAPPIDASPANLTNQNADPYICPATGTLSQASELVIGWLATNAIATTWTADSPNLLAGVASLNAGSIRRAAIGYQVVAATTSVAPEFSSVSGAASCVAGTASFLLDVGGGASTRWLWNA